MRQILQIASRNFVIIQLTVTLMILLQLSREDHLADNNHETSSKTRRRCTR